MIIKLMLLALLYQKFMLGQADRTVLKFVSLVVGFRTKPFDVVIEFFV